jgi:hypothetical protein
MSLRGAKRRGNLQHGTTEIASGFRHRKSTFVGNLRGYRYMQVQARAWLSFLGAALVLTVIVLALLLGCSMYQFTDHGRCVEDCEKKYRPSGDAYTELACKRRCDRALGHDCPDKTDFVGRER